MGKHRQAGAQRLVEQNLLGRVRNMIGAADDVGDPHIHVVGDHAQVVGGTAIGAQQHEVFQFGVGELYSAENGVVEKRAARLGHGKADGRGLSCSPAAGAFFARNLAAGSFVAWRAACGGCSRAALLQFFLGAKAIIGVSGGYEFRRILAVHFDALSLMVGAFIPVEAEPAHALQNALDHFRGGALEIGVFNAQDQGPAIVPGEQPVEQRRAGSAHVQITSRRGCEADARERTGRGGHYERTCPDGTG